jgi:uncharacterized protein
LKRVFADAGYWVALLNPRDSLHEKAVEIEASLGTCQIITTEMVLVEFLNEFGKHGSRLRQAAAGFTAALRAEDQVTIVPQTSTQFWSAVQLYTKRGDKRWSLTDCASCLLMEEQGIGEALTYDRHFEQMGFRALLRG